MTTPVIGPYSFPATITVSDARLVRAFGSVMTISLLRRLVLVPLFIEFALMLVSYAHADTTALDADRNRITLGGYVDSAGRRIGYSSAYAVPVSTPKSSGTIAAGGTAQAAVAANVARKGGYCQSDPRNTDTVEFAFGTTASATPGAANDCVLTPGGVCPFIIGGGVWQGAVSVVSATTGAAYNCTETQ